MSMLGVSSRWDVDYLAYSGEGTWRSCEWISRHPDSLRLFFVFIHKRQEKNFLFLFTKNKTIMKKLRLLLTLIAVSIGAMQGAWARTVPVFPEAQTLESGQTYYLYNVGSNQFVYRNNSDVYANATTPLLLKTMAITPCSSATTITTFIPLRLT